VAKHSLTAIIPAPPQPERENPALWSNKQAMLFARKQGWNHKDPKSLRNRAVALGLEVHPLAVSAGLIRSIAAVMQNQGGI